MNWLLIGLGVAVLVWVWWPPRLHRHRYVEPVLPDGGPAGAAMLDLMALTGEAPYRCRCGRMALR